jgi:hypothetical protein
MRYIEFNSDQRREAINTRQRFQAWRDAVARHRAYRGSMVWSRTHGHDYLMRAAYDASGRRRQTSLGARDVRTERVKAEFERARAEAVERVEQLRPVLARQAGINRVLGLGRVPVLSARILRALDAHGLLGAGIRVVGTHAIYAFEAAAGVHVDSGLTTTEDVELLLDARRGVSFIASEDVETASLLKILRKVDTSFSRSRQAFRAVNKSGYLVDLIKPLRNPPWTAETTKVGDDPGDLSAVEIAGLAWHESAPAFEATAVDERGEPLRIVTSDPRVFVAHAYCESESEAREPLERRRDVEQAQVIAALVATHFPHLPFEVEALRMLPEELFAEVKPLSVATKTGSEFDLRYRAKR